MQYDRVSMLMNKLATNLGGFQLLFQRTRSFHHGCSANSKVQTDIAKGGGEGECSVLLMYLAFTN